MDLQRRGVAAVAAGGTGLVGVLRGGGPGGPLRRGRGGRADTVLCRGGGSLVVGGVMGWSAWWMVLPSQALVLIVHGGLWPGGVG